MQVPTDAPTSPRFLQIKCDLQERLGALCAEMPTPLFNQMVERIALVQFAYEVEPIERTMGRLR